MASWVNIQMFLQELRQADEAGDPDLSDPPVLSKTRQPVLLLHGARSHPMNIDFVKYVAGRVPNTQIRAIGGAGHYGPQTKRRLLSTNAYRFSSQ